MKIKFDVGNWKHPDGFIAEYLLNEFWDSQLYKEVICQKCSRFNSDCAECTDELSPALKECPFNKIYKAIKVAADLLEDVFYEINKNNTPDEIDEYITILFDIARIKYKHAKGEAEI